MTLTYRYRAAAADGGLVEGELRAGSPHEAAESLRRQTLVPVTVEVVAADGARRRRWGPGGGGRRDDALAGAARTIAVLLGGGGTLDRALAFAATHAATPEVGDALAGVRRDVHEGEPLSAALRSRAAVFGTLAPAVARAGEESGTLDTSMARLAEHYERSRDLRAQLRAALWYPALMGVVSGAGVVVLLAFVVPRFAAMLADTGGTLPATTRLLVALSGVVTRGWWLLLALAVLASLGARRWAGRGDNRRRWHAARLRWPVWGAVEQALETARFAHAFGTLLAGGAGVLASVRVAREAVGNRALASALDDAARRLERGERVSAALEGALPPLATQLLAVGEEGGALAGMAATIAARYDNEAQRTLRSLVALVEPVLIVAFGGVVGFVALAMLQAVYAINAGGT